VGLPTGILIRFDPLFVEALQRNSAVLQVLPVVIAGQ
jgi:hypothetical protein